MVFRVFSPTLWFTVSLCAADAWFAILFVAGLIVNSYLPLVVELGAQQCIILTLGKYYLNWVIFTTETPSVFPILSIIPDL